MTELSPILTIYLPSLAIIFSIYLGIQQLKARRSRAIWQEESEAGLTEPASLHPVIDPNRCMGCGSCVTACPEQANHPVLGLIEGKAQLIAPTNCIGHGACKTACPFDAITLVFGTERRGVDIPVLQSNFETSMPNIFIAGELGGMGLIKNAVEQGVKALEALHASLDRKRTHAVDVVIIGAGPAGFAATLRAAELNLNYATLEQESLGGTVYQFPRGKLVMTAPVDLPTVGKVHFTETTKEELLEFWQQVERESEVSIRYQERVEAIEPDGEGGYKVTTNKGSYQTQSVLLAIGRRGTPRKLGVPGEELSKIVYRLIDPEQYRGQHVLVVGGGDSALEAATSIAEQPGTQVTLSYRSGAFSRAKKRNRQRLEAAEQSGSINVLLSSNVTAITEKQVTLQQDDKQIEIANDATIICAGGILPTGFLKQIGITVETKHGTA
ncbi:NAD(P)-binding domain-containing protein [Candidatus Endoriftia persephonae]|jgi:thioredoxin reductase/ferredoxin|uniref:Thioredoxin reductase n=2 Tax=Gammaproteobacteria TaxID=1236 RepID=G2FGQ9_9GAMM|nr:NAD(P)-binding domain-containing protein [Candidatus Endoriftia persephone]EGW54023.1 thioredoxin reductase [endosymbiont of Tevnia jerichonana (vent Tica)]USF86571.1 NAD(P)-binding domain-containing protein [Candidatus Endoriftia persephone]